MATNGIVLITPSSVDVTGGGSETATINAGGSVTFAACESLSLNDVFSSTYDNYVIDIQHLIATGGDAVMRMRLRASGSDNSTASSYTEQRLTASSTTVAGSRSSNDFGVIGDGDTEQRSGTTLFVYGPALAQPTAMRGVSVVGDAGAFIHDAAVTHNQSTAYDGFTLYIPSRTFEGLIKVYGLVQ